MVSPISRLLSHYGAKQVPTGSGWRKINCPFHPDRHASATVNNDVNAFNCFACEVSGDLYKIIMIQEGINFREAKSRAEEITGTSDITLSTSSKLGRRVSNQQGTISARRRVFPPGGSTPTTRRSRGL